jgi:hypothetical protein
MDGMPAIDLPEFSARRVDFSCKFALGIPSNLKLRFPSFDGIKRRDFDASSGSVGRAASGSVSVAVNQAINRDHAL